MVRTVLVSLYEVVPPRCGAAVATYELARHLPGARHLIHLAPKRREPTIRDGFDVLTVGCPTRKALTKALGMLVALPTIAVKVHHLSPDCVIIEGASWALYQVLLLWAMKLFGTRARFAYHAHNVEYRLRQAKNAKPLVMLTRWAEGVLLRTCDPSFAVSEVDASVFEELYGVRPTVVPNGVDVAKFTAVDDSAILRLKTRHNLEGMTVLFMGIPNYQPNREALQFLVCEVFPEVVRRCPDARLAVIGGKVDYRFDWLISPGSIPFDEVPAFVRACDVCVAPIFSGSGTRLKILEYMAAAKPVISTRKGAEGLSVTDGANLVLAETGQEFSDRTVELLGDAPRRQRIGEAGRQLVSECYSWDAIAATAWQALGVG
jgi:glycosyltransferase involved in cell wall biosynthesis